MPQNNQLIDADSNSLHYRPGTLHDRAAMHDLFVDAVWDLAWRIGIQDGERIATPAERKEEMQHWLPTLDHLAATADQFWVAERAGKMVGYARSIVRDEVRELTEFFVLPQAQTVGIGRELLTLAMPPGARRTYIIATLDLRAQALYHKLGAYQICAVYTFLRTLEPVVQPANASQEIAQSDLVITPITPQELPKLAKLDQTIHGHQRPDDHLWLMSSRSGFLLLRDQSAVGYGYVGTPYSGPFALLNDADYSVALAHAENLASSLDIQELGFDTPMLNRSAIKYLLGHGYHMSPFFCFYMCDQEPMHVNKTIITAPMIMI